MSIEGFDFDFSRKPKPTRVERDISDDVNKHIDVAFAKARAAEPKREYVGASAVGDECLRKLQYGYMQVPLDQEPEGKMLRIWRTGHVFEAEVGHWLKMAGFKLQTIDPETRKQFGFTVLNDDGQGHFDGIVTDGPLDLAYPFLWECKALNEKNWQPIKKNGLAIGKPIYAGQMAIGQGYLNLLNPGMFTALNKATSELHHELVPFDQKLAQQMSDRMALVVQASRDEQLLPRAYASEDNFRCKLCDWKKSCWSMKR